MSLVFLQELRLEKVDHSGFLLLLLKQGVDAEADAALGAGGGGGGGGNARRRGRRGALSSEAGWREGL